MKSGTAIARRVCETIECRLRPLIALSTSISIAIIERRLLAMIMSARDGTTPREIG